jgi:hypothetical protein
MKGLRSIVPLPRESLRGLQPAKVQGGAPTVEWVDPRDLFVEESYQREVGEKGVRLIRRIYSTFSWARYKFPVCVRMKEFDALVCVDGQHTAIACASHPSLGRIPVMVVHGASAADRASAFVGHNRDRVALTPVAIFHAELAAGDDPVAQAVLEACRRAGAEVLDKSINLRQRTEVGATIAVGALKSVARRRGADHLTRVLRVLVEAGRGPIKAAEIVATDVILTGAGKVPVIDGRLRVVVASKSAEAWAAVAAASAAQTGESIGSAIATAWCRELELRLSGGLGQPVLLRRPSPIDREPGSDLVRKAPLPGSDLVEVPDLSDLPPEVLAELRPKPLPPRRDAPFRKAPQVTAEPRPHAEPAAPPPKPAPAPENAPAAPAPPPPPDSREVVRRNGVVLDLATRDLTHRGKTVKVRRDDGARMVAALIKVMPALLDQDRLAAKAFPKDNARDGRQRIKLLIDDVNPVLRAAKLEIRTMKVGSMLADLG